MRKFLRFRLSTVFFALAIFGLLLGWYVDHRRRYRDDIVGVWYYPTPDMAMSGYWETFTIRRDGTFTKLQKYRVGSESYSGEYRFAKDGVVTFHVTSKQYNDGFLPTQIKTFAVDDEFRCRVAVDSQRHLMVADLNAPFSRDNVAVRKPEDPYVRWNSCYSPLSHDEQNAARSERLQAEIKRIIDVNTTMDNVK